MKTRLEGNRLIIRDQPFGFWLFYSFFVAGGLMALFLSLSAAPECDDDSYRLDNRPREYRRGLIHDQA